MVGVVLRDLRPGDEAAALEAHRAMAEEDFGFLLGWDDTLPFRVYLDLLERRRTGSAAGPAIPATLLIAEADGEIVGRAHLRHRLDGSLLEEGGHLGFAVLPAHRRRGYATTIVEQAVARLRELGVHEVLVTCGEDNIASRRTIERCGGRLGDVIPRRGGGRTCRYWIGPRAFAEGPTTTVDAVEIGNDDRSTA